MRAGTLIGTRAARGLGPDPRLFRLTVRQIEALAQFEAAFLGAKTTPTVRELAREFLVTPGAIVWRLRGLVRKGWLVPPPDCRHRYELSDAAIEHLQSFKPEITAWIPKSIRDACRSRRSAPRSARPGPGSRG